MFAYVLPPGCKSLESLTRVERPEPQPGHGQILVRIRAVSLNYRDQMIAAGEYFGMQILHEIIPASDAAGEVVGVGEGVSQFKIGDRVTACFLQADPRGLASGQPAPLGLPLDGVLTEFVVLHEAGVVRIPDRYTFEEASCLPCAGVTAWNALMVVGRPVAPGDIVLVLGSGGVSMWALQLARAAGARVLVTSSSDEKLLRAKNLGAADGINYRRNPDWEREVLRLTGGRGADCIIEVGGEGTLSRSFQALAVGGKVALIGVLAAPSGAVDHHTLMFKRGSLHGVMVGEKALFESLIRAVEVNDIRPVIDRVFGFGDAKAAFAHHRSGQFVGKVVIAV
jgi:NADPH:quinone reductase-like Zn-dependent oxidoreductase